MPRSLASLWLRVCLDMFYGSIIYLNWPDSKVGMWIAAVVKRILAEATRIKRLEENHEGTESHGRKRGRYGGLP